MTSSSLYGDPIHPNVLYAVSSAHTARAIPSRELASQLQTMSHLARLTVIPRRKLQEPPRIRQTKEIGTWETSQSCHHNDLSPKSLPSFLPSLLACLLTYLLTVLTLSLSLSLSPPHVWPLECAPDAMAKLFLRPESGIGKGLYPHRGRSEVPAQYNEGFCEGQGEW